MTIIIGIDPGLDGAIAVLTEAGELVAIHDMPTLLDGAKGRRAVNPALFASIIYSTQASRAYCELIGPRPTDGTTGAFGFGRTRGNHRGRARRRRRSARHDRAAGLEARAQHCAGEGEQGQRPQRRNQPMAFAGGALRAQVRLRPRRSGADRARRPDAGWRTMNCHPANLDARLRHLAAQIYALGPRPLYELLRELDAGAPLRPRLEAYARLQASFIRANNGDELDERPLFAIAGGRRYG